MQDQGAFLRLDQQVAVVTGGGAGIGEAIVKRLGSAGARVAIVDLDVEAAQAVAASIPGATAWQADVTSFPAVSDVFSQIAQALGTVSILVNNAGIAGKAAPFIEQTDDDWSRMIALNLMGVVNCSRAVLPGMRAQRYGRIVNIASIAGKEGNPNMTPYSTTKAAVIGLTKSLAKEVATESICINAVAPANQDSRSADARAGRLHDGKNPHAPYR
jgi:NAD(P)-dependent dehydrogenase (short-subunit alcohol dehydrogenase family)